MEEKAFGVELKVMDLGLQKRRILEKMIPIS
jgi:hypothetical protein